MPAQVITSVENNFTKGFVTEFTGLNFPENAATDTDNCEYTIVGDVLRRQGINNEVNYTTQAIDRTGVAVSSYKWNNASGDGLSQIIVEQVGNTLYFYLSSSATVLSPLSSQYVNSPVLLSTYTASGGTFDPTLECQYADGNGYLFVYHPSCDPIYCIYSSATSSVISNRITVQIRDFQGVVDNLSVNFRPSTLSDEHLYNLSNQGWTKGSGWVAISLTAWGYGLGSKTLAVAAGIVGVTIGDRVAMSIYGSYPIAAPPDKFGEGTTGYTYVYATGNVTVYAGVGMNINITSITGAPENFTPIQTNISAINHGYTDTWNSAVGGYPSNADVWWYFKNASGVFDPATTINNVTLNTGNAAKGHYIINAFDQQRDVVSTITTITDVTTVVRPRTGTWFQGRVWYTGCDASVTATGNANAFSWTESIYFSQTISDVSQFGNCFQTNDPSSELLFDLLPTDGGVIKIQGCGSIYKLFPIQNGMLVFASNGIWFITGSQGIGFSANDYTITKISSIQCISSTSFVNVQGLPYFWNEEGIYAVEPSKNGGLEVNPLTVGTILSFYGNIPVSSKKYVRGDYNPIDYVIQWVYRSDEAVDVTGRYTYDKIMNFNTYNKAFFPYTVNSTANSINGVIYVVNPGGSNAPEATFKYLASNGSLITFAEEYSTTYTDWGSIDYNSYFVTGFKLHGQGQRRFQLPYLYIFSRADEPTSYKIQGLWDYATSGNSGRWSTAQLINNWSPNFGMIFRRHRIRGSGLVLQIKISSSPGQPFDIMGWSSFETMNASV